MLRKILAAIAASLFTVLVLSGCAKEKTDSAELNSFEIVKEQDIKHTVNLKDNGIIADDIQKAKENTKIINNAIRKADEFTKIIIPDGTYYIDCNIKFSGKKNIILCGSDNTTLINTAYEPIKKNDLMPMLTGKKSNIFFVENGNNVVISRLTLDYLYHTTLDGVITDIKNGKTYFKAYNEFLSGSRKPVTGDEMCFSALIANKTDFYNEVWFDNNTTIKKEDDNGLFSIPASSGNIGDRICCRISSGSYYSTPLIYITETSGLELSDITSYSCPSAFIYAPYNNSDFLFSRINIAPELKSQRLLASNEDIIHIKQLSGKLTISDCNFSHLGDDALNVHSKLGRLSEINGNKANVIMADTGEKPLKYFFKENDTAEFFDASGNSLGTSKVLSYKNKKIEFEKIPEGVTDDCLIQNITCVPETVIENCNIGFGRARGVLLQTKKATVKNCSFNNLRLPAILITPDFDYWFEAGYSDSIEISSNKFTSCASLNNGFGVIHISGCHDDPNYTSQSKNHKSITIKDNSFTGSLSQHVKATGVESLVNEN